MNKINLYIIKYPLLNLVIGIIIIIIFCSIFSLDTVYAREVDNIEIIEKKTSKGIILITVTLMVASCIALGAGLAYVLNKYNWFSFSVEVNTNTDPASIEALNRQSYNVGYENAITHIYKTFVDHLLMLREEIVDRYDIQIIDTSEAFKAGAHQAILELFNALDEMPDLSKEDFYNLVSNRVMVSSMEPLCTNYQLITICVLIVIVIFIITKRN